MSRYPETKTFNLIGKYAIIQGGKYFLEPIILVNAGDYTSWNCRGQIRKNYDSEEIIASFFFTSEYGDEYAGKSYPNSTFFFGELGATVTSDIEATPVLTGSPVPGKNVWVYDVEIFNPDDEDDVIKPVRGFVQVLAEVTR